LELFKPKDCHLSIPSPITIKVADILASISSRLERAIDSVTAEANINPTRFALIFAAEMGLLAFTGFFLSFFAVFFSHFLQLLLGFHHLFSRYLCVWFILHTSKVSRKK
jgi:hypothetical protein